jgi:hypothetical protein
LTDFGSARNFEQLLRRHRLVSGYKRLKLKPSVFGGVRYGYTWTRKGLMIMTGNNPLTGKFSSPSQRVDEKGYASHIQIKGRREDVEALVRDIIGVGAIKGL